MTWLTGVTRAMVEARQVAVVIAALLGAAIGTMEGVPDPTAEPRLPSAAASAPE